MEIDGLSSYDDDISARGLESDPMFMAVAEWNGREVSLKKSSITFNQLISMNKSGSKGTSVSGDIQASGGGNGSKDYNASASGSVTVTQPIGTNTTVSGTVTGGVSSSSSGGNKTAGGGVSGEVRITRDF